MDKDKLAEKLSALIINRLDNLHKDYEKPWISTQILPMNISGRKYTGQYNILFLLLYNWSRAFQNPIFITPLQAKKLELNFKGAHTTPVIYSNYKVTPVTATHPSISLDKYYQLSDKEKSNYHLTRFISCSFVMNIQETNYANKYPERWRELLNLPELYEHHSKNLLLDQLISQQEWICPIYEQIGNIAAHYYNAKESFITLPHRSQYKNINDFYSTTLHEIAHSTGIHLNRFDEKNKSIRNKDYAFEELVAELTAIFVGIELRINCKINENNLAYLKIWRERLGDDPLYIQRATKESLEASHFIMEHIYSLHPEMQVQVSPSPNLILQNLNRELIHTEKNNKPYKLSV